MSSYDSRTTSFNSDGRILQVEYAMEAVNSGSPTVCLICKEGIIMLGERFQNVGNLFDHDGISEKIVLLNETVLAAICGIASDGSHLVDVARDYAVSLQRAYGGEVQADLLAKRLSLYCQNITQRGGARPFGVSIIIGGRTGSAGKPGLFKIDPMGVITVWNAIALGRESTTALTKLKDIYEVDLSMEDALKVGMRVLLDAVDNDRELWNSIEVRIMREVDPTKPLVIESLSEEEMKLLIQSSLDANKVTPMETSE